METDFNNEGYALAKEMYEINKIKILEAAKAAWEELGNPLTPSDATFIEYGYILGAFSVINAVNKQGIKIIYKKK